MDERKNTNDKTVNPTSAIQHEDAALKTMMNFFAEELLPLLGIQGKVVSSAPTELIKLDISKLYEDFNLIMEDGSWKHFEFQSTNEGLDGLKRFRSYEALASYQHKVSVTTYVLFSGNIRNPMTEFTEGANTYRIIPIIFKNRNADTYIKKLKTKIQCRKSITKAELIWLTLCPLMGGEMSQKDRIKSAYEITKETISITENELRQIEAVIYAMADKFLDSKDMKEIEEAVRMTKLGQMLVDTGKREGKIEGNVEGEARFAILTQKLLKDSRTDDLLRATNDLAFRKALYCQYGIHE